MYQNITKKLQQKEPFLRDINEFKKKYTFKTVYFNLLNSSWKFRYWRFRAKKL